jgi:hypothetical protein
MDIKSEKAKFLEKYVLSSAVLASLERNELYNNRRGKDFSLEKYKFKQFYRDEIEKFGQGYLCGVQYDVDTFVKDILLMRIEINDKFSKIFVEGGIRLAHCQKSLSVYLKYKWCQGLMGTCMPPVCPIDSMVLGEAIKKDKKDIIRLNERSWTAIDDENALRSIYEVLENDTEVKDCGGMALWELKKFNQ